MWAARATPDPGDLPPPRHPLFEGRWPVVALAGAAALAERSFECRPRIRLGRRSCDFADDARCVRTRSSSPPVIGSTSRFCRSNSAAVRGWEFPLYRRILSPHAEGLAFIGILEPGPGLLEIVERQAEWLGEVLGRAASIPDAGADVAGDRAAASAARDASSAATGPHTLLCNRHAYLRLLARSTPRQARCL